jgi:hypothetical protein
MEVPVEVEVVRVVLMHQRLAGIGVGEESFEKARDLVRVVGRVEIRRGRRGIDLLPLVVRTAMLVPLEEDRESVLLHVRCPSVVEHAPDLHRDGLLFAQVQINQGERRPFPSVFAAQEERLHGAFDVVHVERWRH